MENSAVFIFASITCAIVGAVGLTTYDTFRNCRQRGPLKTSLKCEVTISLLLALVLFALLVSALYLQTMHLVLWATCIAVNSLFQNVVSFEYLALSRPWGASEGIVCLCLFAISALNITTIVLRVVGLVSLSSTCLASWLASTIFLNIIRAFLRTSDELRSVCGGNSKAGRRKEEGTGRKRAFVEVTTVGGFTAMVIIPFALRSVVAEIVVCLFCTVLTAVYRVLQLADYSYGVRRTWYQGLHRSATAHLPASMRA